MSTIARSYRHHPAGGIYPVIVQVVADGPNIVLFSSLSIQQGVRGLGRNSEELNRIYKAHS